MNRKDMILVMRKTRAAAFLLSLLLLVPGQAVLAEPAALAEDLTKKCTFQVSASSAKAGNLSDGNFNTVWKGGNGSTIDISSSAPIGGLYILWNSIPSRWSVETAGETPQTLYTGQGKTFLHEYAPLTDAAPLAVRLRLEAAAIADIYVLGVGETPDWVQQWQPMFEKADMLVMSTHADDEHLWFGGTMPVYAGEYRKKVQVSYLTNHGPQRTHELLNGLWTVGIRAYPMISSFPDYYAGNIQVARQKYDENKILEYQMMLLRRFKPDVIISQDINGEYGHGVHCLNVHTLRQALEMSADASQFPEVAKKYGTWQVKKCYMHLYWKNRLVMDWSQPLQNFGGKIALDVAKDGFACHVSQQKPRWKVRDFGEYDCRQFGLYYSTVGLDVKKNDFFENINPCIPWAALPAPADGTDPKGNTKTLETTATTTPPPTTTTTLPPETTTTAAPPTTTTTTVADPVTGVDDVLGTKGEPEGRSPFFPLFFILPGVAVVLLAGGGAAWFLLRRKRGVQTHIFH